MALKPTQKPEPQAEDGPPQVYEHAVRVDDPGPAASSGGSYVDTKLWHGG